MRAAMVKAHARPRREREALLRPTRVSLACRGVTHGQFRHRTRTRVARVRAEYPNQLDYSGRGGNKKSGT